jgi:predicted flap endonuclease-1-like 5' DNA nuclease
MALIDDVSRSVAHGVRGLAAGVWAAVATPLVYTPLRPLAKQAVKGGLWIAHGARSLVEVTREEWADLATEARAEIEAGEPVPMLESGTSAASDAPASDGAPAENGEQLALDNPEEPAGTDLTAVKGIGDDYAALLRAAGITSIPELAGYDPEALRTVLHEANEQGGIVGRVPSTGRIRGWIEWAAEHS